MISHALSIVINELDKHLTDAYGPPVGAAYAGLANIAEGAGTAPPAAPRELVTFSIVNIREEKALKNLPNQIRNDALLKVFYANQPVFLNCQVLIAATHMSYANALVMLSRVIRFFQFRNVFTQDSVEPGSITKNAPSNPLDHLETFKLIFDLYSPTLEEVNQLWGTLGGKQYPSVMYNLRLLEMQFKATQSEGSLITEVVSDFYLKQTTAV